MDSMIPVSEVKARSAESAGVLCKVPVFRPVAIKVMSVLTKPDVNFLEIADLLNCDPGFSAEVLTMANSALYSLPRQVNTVERAVMVLGLERTGALVTRAAVQGMVRGMEENEAVKNCWMHSRASAAIGAWLSHSFRLHPDRAYTAALMHDIGRLGLLCTYGARYADLLSRSAGSHQGLMDVERTLFSVDHCEAGAWLTRVWGLPTDFQETALRHHQDLEGSQQDLTALVGLACALAHGLEFRAAPLVESSPLEPLFALMPDYGLSRNPLSVEDLAAYVTKEMSV